jgi:hypothetical protein
MPTFTFTAMQHLILAAMFSPMVIALAVLIRINWKYSPPEKPAQRDDYQNQ